MLSPVQNKITFIMIGITRNQTKHTTITLRIYA